MDTSETVIRDASVIDGTGRAPFVADVAISGGKIVRVGPAGAVRAEATIEAAGLTLAPGFIDVHTHDDTNVVRTPAMWPKLSQGVTTVVTPWDSLDHISGVRTTFVSSWVCTSMKPGASVSPSASIC